MKTKQTATAAIEISTQKSIDEALSLLPSVHGLSNTSETVQLNIVPGDNEENILPELDQSGRTNTASELSFRNTSNSTAIIETTDTSFENKKSVDESHECVIVSVHDIQGKYL